MYASLKPLANQTVIDHKAPTNQFVRVLKGKICVRMSFQMAGMILSTTWILSGCAAPTPLQQCISNATYPYEATASAIYVAEGNVARGYAINRSEESYQIAGTCFNGYTYYSCPSTQSKTVETPVTLSVAEERYKLQQYYTALPGLKRQAESASQQCRKQYPAT